jgi:hypothetical protein
LEPEGGNNPLRSVCSERILSFPYIHANLEAFFEKKTRFFEKSAGFIDNFGRRDIIPLGDVVCPRAAPASYRRLAGGAANKTASAGDVVRLKKRRGCPRGTPDKVGRRTV